jgi:hypothetical protein
MTILLEDIGCRVRRVLGEVSSIPLDTCYVIGIKWSWFTFL